MKKESQETAADETKESPEKQAKEDAEGTEQHGEGIDLPEDFQKETHEFIHKHAHSKHRLAHIRRKTYEAEDKLRKDKKKPDEFSLESAPSM